jgi:hypothetical protein
MPTQTFQITAQVGGEYRLRVARIVHDFGDGYDSSALVGNAAGEEFVTLVFNALTDRTSDQITDPEDSTSKTKFEYLHDFFLARMVDGAAFNVVTTRGDTLLVKFVESEISATNISRKAFSTGLRFRQYRS